MKRVRAGTYRDISAGLFIDRNERVLPFSAETLDLLSQHLAKIPLSLYPELEPFYRKLSQWLGIDKSCIYVTEGVSGAIKSLIETIANSGANIVFPTPTFALYPVYCQMFNLAYRTVGYTKDYKLDLDHLLRQIDERTAIVFLPNPNMPIEGTLDLQTISSLAHHCRQRGSFLAIDEVYYPFGGPTAVGLLQEHDNLLVIRSFSKAFGLAGIRVGYVLGASDMIDYISKTRTGYETNSVSMEVATFFIDHFAEVENYIKTVKTGLAYLKQELDALTLEYNGGNTGNFIYVNLQNKNKAETIVNALRAKKIYIRGGWPRPFDTGFSVTGASQELMEQFFHAFHEIFVQLPA